MKTKEVTKEKKKKKDGEEGNKGKEEGQVSIVCILLRPSVVLNSNENENRRRSCGDEYGKVEAYPSRIFRRLIV